MKRIHLGGAAVVTRSEMLTVWSTPMRALADGEFLSPGSLHSNMTGSVAVGG